MLKRLVMPATAFAATLALLVMLAPGLRGSSSVATSDRYVIGEDLKINTPVKGSVIVLNGSADVSSTIDGDLFVIGGTVTLLPGGMVSGNLIHSGRINSAGGRVRGSTYAASTVQGATASISRSAVILSLLFLWIIGAIALTASSGREVRLSSVEVRASALYCFTLGLVAVTSFVLTAIVFSYLIPYVVGIPLLAGLGMFAVLTKIYGMIAVFHAVGTLVAGSRTRDQLDRRKWLRGDMAMVLIGVLILGALRLIPGVGTIVWSLASIFGVGVALGTKFGRREPWFLAWRPVEA
jgi:hypothetical protein